MIPFQFHLVGDRFTVNWLFLFELIKAVASFINSSTFNYRVAGIQVFF